MAFEAPAFRIVDREDEFLQLREDWNHLAATAHTPSVFLRHEWFEAAWRWRRADGTLCVLCGRKAGHLVVVVPLLRRTQSRYGMSLRSLEFLTVPDTQLCDIVVAREMHEAMVGAVLAALRDQLRDWDVLDLNYLPAASPTPAALEREAARGGWKTTVRSSHRNFYISLSQGWQAFYASRSRRLKKANNLIANRLGKAFKQVEVQWLKAGEVDAASLDRLLDTVVAVSASSWKRHTGLSLDRPGPGAFIRTLAGHARGQGWLSVWVLRLDGRAAAMEFQLLHEGQVYALRADFDEGLNTHSPGSYLNWKLVETLCESGLVRYWMGPGANAYKLHWSEQCEVLSRVTVYGRTVRGSLLGLIERRIRPLVAAARRPFAGKEGQSQQRDKGRSSEG